MVSVALLEAVVALAREAGRRILAHYHGEVTRWEKADSSPLTQADRDAHAVLATGLARLEPGVPVISEEGEVPPYEARRDWEHFWLVDPLDGTKEFLKRNGEFTVNVALVEGGEPVMGVVLAPALTRLYYAAHGAGAWKLEGQGVPARIQRRAVKRGDPLTMVESRSHPSPDMEAYLSLLPIARRFAAGSSLKFCLVAEGAADFYPRLGPTMEWDVAAGDAIYREATAGGRNVSPLRYNKPDLRNDSFVIGPAWLPAPPTFP